MFCLVRLEDNDALVILAALSPIDIIIARRALPLAIIVSSNLLHAIAPMPHAR